MREALHVHVNDALQQLSGVEAYDFLPESARVRNILVQLAASDELLYDVGDRNLGPVLDHHGLFFEVDILDNASVVQLVGGLHLLLEQLKLHLIELRIIHAENLDGV